MGKCAPVSGDCLFILIGLIGIKVPPVGSPSGDRAAHRKEQPMLDVILLAGGLAFFALSIAYAFGCERL
jgi:hypothetical protein